MNIDQIDNDELFYFNGINGSTGKYAVPPMSADKLSDLVLGKPRVQDGHKEELHIRHDMRDFLPMGPKEGVDPKELSQAGWGIIFPHGADPAIKEALRELLDLRQEQAGDYFRVYEGPDAVRPGETKLKFLARHGVGPGPADPDKMSYYLLLVGSPEQIPYTFQYELDVQYAVGRIHFETLSEYVNYARSVVSAERESLQLARKAAFFSTANDDDRATQLSTKHMMRPLYDLLQAAHPEWEFAAHMEAGATKEQLGQLIGGDQTPSLLFTSSHGVNFPKGSPRQLPHQGALLCQEWPGPSWKGGQIPQDFYFAGDDLVEDQSLLGLICFSFACYSAGTPRYDDFSAMTFKDPEQIAPNPFMAQLPSRMLSHAAGGALAFIGHVDRAWGHSFMWPGAGPQTVTIESVLRRLLDGHPVGSAVEYINQRYAEVSSALTSLQGNHEFGGSPDPHTVAGLWTANNDARDYTITGDPAVRLPVAMLDETERERPIVDLSTASRQLPQNRDEGAIISFSSEFETDGEMLTVSTYEASDVKNGPRTLKAQTKISANGNLETTISDSMTEDDQHILITHNRNVDQAIEARLAHQSMT